LQQDLDLPYLLLDLRDKDEYDQCHIISAINYPTAMLSRSINNETPELLAYKNQPGKIIVVYDDEERIAPKAASTLVQRGYDNLFLLSGGLRLASKKFPDGLITGTLPAYFALPTPKDQKTGRSISSSVLNSSNASNITNRSYATKRTFDREDIEKLNQHLDENLMPSDSLSRMSRNTKSSRNSTISNVSLASNKTATSIHDKPWKPF
jgi:centrosomal protein CEP41